METDGVALSTCPLAPAVPGPKAYGIKGQRSARSGKPLRVTTDIFELVG
jgi:hypothetical protein